MHVYAQADDAQILIELGMATIKPETGTPYPHLVSMEMTGDPTNWEKLRLACDEVPCEHTAYRIPDPDDAKCGWLVSHGIVQWHPAVVWRALERWAYVQPEAVAVS